MTLDGVTNTSPNFCVSVRRKPSNVTKDISGLDENDELKELDNQRAEAYYADREWERRLMWKPEKQ